MVNTFILATSLAETARLLDARRLNKQKVEAYQIIRAIEGKSKNRMNHPAVLMWKDHVDPLKCYFNAMLQEWIDRGYNNNMEFYSVEQHEIIPIEFDGRISSFPPGYSPSKRTFPWWFGWQPLIMSHRYRKDPEFYNHFFDECLVPYINIGYIWPHTLKYLEEFTFDLHAPIGSGAPAFYTISKEDALDWNQNRNVNPKTKRKITPDGEIYRKYLEAYGYWKDR